MTNKGSAILELHRQGQCVSAIARLLRVSHQLVSKGIKRYKEPGNDGDRPGDRKKTVNPSRSRKVIQKRVARNHPDFISAQEWPPYSRDLNPLDYSVWSILEARAWAKPHKCLEALKRSLTREWDRITPAELRLRPIAENFIQRLRLRIEAKGGHFEEK
ncbi:unnamed protein product, partial [Mesorhabditis belari]|uniref:Uncharacterized protein n=1 Tax=Mesorhabditis belari TaxID=2138241 RepID=A0AAF3EUV7_9BILA